MTQVDRHPPDPARRRRQGHRPRGATAPTSRLPGMLWGKVVRSPHAHARIKSIDTSKAAALPGVQGRHHVPGISRFPDRGARSASWAIQDMREMSPQRDGARQGAVSRPPGRRRRRATRTRSRRRRSKLIEVDYEVLPWVIDVEEAMQPDAPILHDHMHHVASRQALEHRRASSSTSSATSRRASPRPT